MDWRDDPRERIFQKKKVDNYCWVAEQLGIQTDLVFHGWLWANILYSLRVTNAMEGH